MTNFEKNIKRFAIILAILVCLAMLCGMIRIVQGITKGIHRGAEAVSGVAEMTSDTIAETSEQVHKNLYDGIVSHLPDAADYYFSLSDVEDLSIENGIEELSIVESDGNQIHVSLESSNEYCEVSLSGDTLKVMNSGVNVEIFGVSIGEKVDNANKGLIIEIPKGFRFDDVSIDNGIGSLNITGLNAEEIEITSGTGSINCENIDAEEIRVVSGVGQVDLDFACAMSDYDMRIKPGVGSITVNGEKQREISHTNKDASKTLRLEGSIGSINVKFDD